ncbi:hypothetical protein BK664_16135 [Pseudomonas brassicacearum]|uniref:Pyrroline-5-carboxylate reductase catalytic N-terminal domain-containing protein n=1 Tax=Pseudomonas brassicacearum TaxID=930166 RepID=A0A423JJQ0_9PSED|nr:hypothetical protein BK664_16135 [Pseudomonas brassicacearum]
MARIAFIGLTDIGQILARKLKSSGHKVQVCPFDSQELDQPSIAAIAICDIRVLSLIEPKTTPNSTL